MKRTSSLRNDIQQIKTPVPLKQYLVFNISQGGIKLWISEMLSTAQLVCSFITAHLLKAASAAYYRSGYSAMALIYMWNDSLELLKRKRSFHQMKKQQQKKGRSIFKATFLTCNISSRLCNGKVKQFVELHHKGDFTAISLINSFANIYGTQKGNGRDFRKLEIVVWQESLISARSTVKCAKMMDEN